MDRLVIAESKAKLTQMPTVYNHSEQKNHLRMRNTLHIEADGLQPQKKTHFV